MTDLKLKLNIERRNYNVIDLYPKKTFNPILTCHLSKMEVNKSKLQQKLFEVRISIEIHVSFSIDWLEQKNLFHNEK